MPEELVEYVIPTTIEYNEARDWLRHELASWPYTTRKFQRFLDALHWRQRAVVTLTYGECLTQERVAEKLGIAPRTVQRDITDVCVLAKCANK